MPDKWEYPWFAAWDLAFHTVALAVVDIAFAKKQIDLLLNRRYFHPNGQLPAYEWNFSDVNPPVHAWAALFVYEIDKAATRKGDRAFLENAFMKLTRNFTWWLNRRTPTTGTSSRADSWALTTSGCSTAVRHCLLAGTSTKPTARRGWPSTART
jgi:hypothetical protein